MALRGEIVNLVRLNFCDQTRERRGIREVTVVQGQAIATSMGVFVNGIEATGIEGTGAADDAMNFIPLCQKKFGEVRAVLPCDTGDKRAFGHNQARGASKNEWGMASL